MDKGKGIISQIIHTCIWNLGKTHQVGIFAAASSVCRKNAPREREREKEREREEKFVVQTGKRERRTHPPTHPPTYVEGGRKRGVIDVGIPK
jgi:hypothetical protein